MNPYWKWLSVAGLSLLVVLAAGAWALQRWVGSPEVKARVQAQAGAALGVAVTLEQLELQLWPWPALVLRDLALQTRPALTAQRLAVRPAFTGLLAGRLELGTLLLHHAQLPQPGIDALLDALSKKKRAAPDPSAQTAQNASSANFLPARTVLDHVTWTSARGSATVLDADIRLDGHGLPDDVAVQVLQGPLHDTRARLLRQGAGWTVDLQAGGGSVQGTVQLQPPAQPGAAFELQGTLQSRALPLGMLTGPQPVLTGQLDADTTWSARATRIGALGDALQTHSTFTVRHAVLHGLDLAKAIKTVGLSRGGTTPLDTLAGQVATQGRAVQLSQLVASSGVLSANGNVAIAPSRALSGRIAVELAAATLGGAVGVPLALGGTLDAPEVMLTRSAMIGAAIGTAVMPGVGTGAGASLGDKVGSGIKKLFGQ